MDQRKIGEFLKYLRKNKGLTQEQLAEHLYVSSRTVSRWETGNNMPDLEILIALADFYEVDIREIIDGEKKSEKMGNEIKDTLEKVAEYTKEDKKKQGRKLVRQICVCQFILLTSLLFFGSESKGLLYGIVPENICNIILRIVLGLSFVFLIRVIVSSGIYEKFSQTIKKEKS